jgi:D-glucosaminate-6-phosphate ammonia-lyase
MNDDPRPAINLRRIINAAGTMTALGSSAAVPEAVGAATDILPWFVEMDDLQRMASRAIGKATGAEAGFVTASASAGITLAIAAAMTGADPSRIARLPDSAGMRSGVIIQRGHLIDYGAPIEQAIRLAGARVVTVDREKKATASELASVFDETIAAGFYVVSHHCEQEGQLSLAAFIAAASRQSVPLIVDAASEYDLTGFIAAGADIVIYSAHKFLGGLTAGIVAGRKDLVRAAYLQNGGIGRGMKVGKEAIVGAIAALEAWSRRDHSAYRRREDERVSLWLRRLAGIDGVRLELSPDPTNNPITRLRVHVAAQSGTSAWALADELAAGERPVAVRDDEIERSYFELDPCNLSDGEAEEVAHRLLDALTQARMTRNAAPSFAAWQANRLAARLAWPD